MMENSQKPAQSFLQRNSKKRWIRACLALVLLCAVFLLVLPHGVRIGLERWLLNNGADQATISKIKINLFTGAASINGLDVTLGGETVLANSNIYLDIGLGALFSREAFIQRASFHNVNVDIEQSEDGSWRIGSISIPPGDVATETKKLEEEAGKLWFFGAQQLEMVDCIIHYSQPDLEMSLLVEHALLTEFSTNPSNASGAFMFKGQLNDAPLDLQLDTLRLAPELEIGGSISTSGLHLDDLADFLQEYINPFSGMAGAEGKFNFTLSQDNTILIDYAGSIDLDEGDIGGPGYATGGKNLTWNGPVSYQQDKSNRIAINLDGSLKGSGLRLNLPDQKLQLLQESFEIKSKTAVNIDQQVTVNSEGKINLSGTNFTMPPYLVQNKNLLWEGNAFYTSAGQHVKIDGTLNLSEPSFTLTEEESETTAAGNIIYWQGIVEYLGEVKDKPANTLSLAGKLHCSELNATLPDPGLHYSQNKITLTNNLTLPLDDPRLLEGTADLQAEGLLLKDSATGQKLVSLERLMVEGLNASGGQSLAVDRVKTEKLELLSPTNDAMVMTISEIILSQLKTEDMQKFSAQTLAVKAFHADNTEQKKQLASIEAILLTDIKADDSLNIAAESLLVNNGHVFEQTISEEKSNFLQFARLSVNKPAWRDKAKLTIADINLEDTQVHFLKDKNGKLLLTQELQELKGEPSEEQPAEGEEKEEKGTSPAFSFQIGEISVTGKSGIRYEDHALKFPFIANLAIETLRITDLDSGHPGKAASYELTGNLDKYAPLTIKGTIKPFAEEFSLQQAASFKNYPMISLAPYSIQYLGIVPTQGTLSVDSKLSIEKDYIDLQKTWLIKKLEIKTIEKELAGEFNSQLPLPLDSALSMLKDRHENIELSIPISGPKVDLDFGITGLFITPLSKAIVSATSSYLLFTLGPYGAAAYVGLKVGEKLMETRVPPVVFEPGKSELTEDHIKYLERIAEILKNRPAIDLQLCAWVLPEEQTDHPSELSADNTKIDKSEQPVELSTDDKKALLKLGNSRAVTIKDYLVLEHDIDPGRLLLCLPELDESKDAQPRVELNV